MSEVDVASEFDQYKMIVTHADHSEFQLPKIHQPIRTNVKSKAQGRRRSQVLPHLVQKQEPRKEKKQSGSPKKRVASEVQRQQFGVQMQQKLKQIMQNVFKGQSIQQSGDREVDFQQAIEYNKQKIKRQKKENNQQKLNKLLRSQSKPDHQSPPPKPNPFKKQSKPNQDISYDKRAKQMSIQNKYLLKKKQIIAQKNQTIEKLKQLKKDREETIASHQVSNSKDHSLNLQQNYNNPQTNNSQSNRSPKIPLPVRYASKSKPVKQQSPIKEPKIQQIKSSINLFDNIHGLLQNPFKNRQTKNPKCSPQKIKQLQVKIKLINNKLGINSNIQTSQTQQKVNIILNKTVLDWKRIELGGKGQNLKCYNDSNFQKEINRVNLLQQKNDNYFNEYLNNQKMILELQLLQKMDTGRDQRKTS